MKANKGFSLVEIIVVLVIVGIVAAMTIPNLVSSSEVTKAQMAQNNLMAISAAEQKFSEDWSGAYCISTGTNPTGFTAKCGDTKANIDSNMHLSISDTFTYDCFSTAQTIPYNCTATDGTDTLTLDPNSASPGVTCTPSAKCP